MKKKRKSKKKKNWELKDFIHSVSQVMKEQEKSNPNIKHLHSRLSPEWRQVSEMIEKLLHAPSEEEAQVLRESIVSKGEIATRFLIDFLLEIKKEKNPL